MSPPTYIFLILAPLDNLQILVCVCSMLGSWTGLAFRVPQSGEEGVSLTHSCRLKSEPCPQRIQMVKVREIHPKYVVPGDCWRLPTLPALWRRRQEEPEFELSLGYIMSLNYIWRPCLKKKKKS
jgi:hypothetical protein